MHHYIISVYEFVSSSSTGMWPQSNDKTLDSFCICILSWIYLIYILQSLLQNRSLFQAICPGNFWARDNSCLLSRVQRLAGPGGATGAFCPGWRHQPGQKGGLLSRLVAPTGTKGPRSLLSRLEPPTGIKGPPFVPVGVSNRDKTPWPPYPLPSPPARAILLTCFLLFLARERGVLAHFFTTFVKIFDSPSIHRR